MNRSSLVCDKGEGRVIAVSRDGRHAFSKEPVAAIEVIAGHGVRGDAHAGATVQHLSRVRQDPTQTNLRQVHLLQAELLDELCEHGFAIAPGDLGENILTRGLDLLGLPKNTVLAIGGQAVLRVTGLRNPCGQIEAFAPGLLRHVAEKRGNDIIRRAGIMAVVEQSGPVTQGDRVEPRLPEGPFQPLRPV